MLLLLALAGGCRNKSSDIYVDRLYADGSPATDGAPPRASAEQVKTALSAALSAAGHFHLIQGSESPPRDVKPFRCRAQILSVLEPKGGEGQTEVLVGLELSRSGEEKYEAQEAGRKETFAKALDEALRHGAEALAMALAATGKADAELVKSLSSEDPKVRDAAIRVLADRKNPAVVPALIERLKDNDREAVATTIGRLVELKDPRAVVPLIDLTRGKDPDFVRQIVYAVGAIGGPEAEAYLFTVESGHQDDQVREAAHEAAQEMKSREHAKATPKRPPRDR